MQVAKAHGNIRQPVGQATAKQQIRRNAAGESKYRTDRAAIQRHFTELRDAGTDQQAFDLAFKK
jgi:hypothetical protein